MAEKIHRSPKYVDDLPRAECDAVSTQRGIFLLSSGLGARSSLPAIAIFWKAAQTGKNPGEIMTRLLVTAIVALSAGVLASCASNPPPPAGTTANLGSTEGTVTFSGGAVAIGIGFQWGSGTLTYQGRQYPFRLDGLSVVDVGVTRVTGTGTVHNLRNLADFSGNYVAVSAGATLAGGGSVGTLRNQNGVVIDGVTTAQGVRLTLAPGGVNIRLSGQPSA